ncbi:MAG: hypothetical protein ACOC5R_01685 [Elusimicrobiota bacterium]
MVNIKENDILTKGLKIISELAPEPTYVVGGYIRNRILGKDNIDADIVSKNLDLPQKFARKFNSKIYSLREKFLYRVHKKKYSWDFTPLKQDINSDLKRRDFKCDAMAVEINNLFSGDIQKNLIDPFNGLDDVKNKVLTPVKEDIFVHDPIRIIRAYRLKNEIGFKISENLNNLIKEQASQLKQEKGERITKELEKIFENPKDSIIMEMAEKDIFKEIFSKTRPEVKIKQILARYKKTNKIEDKFLLMLGAVWDSSDIGERLKISNKKQKILNEFMKENKDIFNCWMRWGKKTEQIFLSRYIITGNERILKVLDKNKQNILKKNKPVISGKEVMKIQNIPSCPKVGLILREILKGQFKGKITTHKDAVRYIKKK